MQIIADHPVVSASAVEKVFADRLNNPAFMAQIARTKLAAGTVFMSGFPDYMPIQPGGAGIVIGRSTVANGVGGDATLVGGAMGQGRVVLAGFSLGAKCIKVGEKYVTSEELTGEEASILINSIFWLGD